MIMPEVMMGVIPSSMSVPLHQYRFPSTQYPYTTPSGHQQTQDRTHQLSRSSSPFLRNPRPHLLPAKRLSERKAKGILCCLPVRSEDDSHPVQRVARVRGHDAVKWDLRADEEDCERDGRPETFLVEWDLGTTTGVRERWGHR
jgi:hypothetical protein